MKITIIKSIFCPTINFVDVLIQSIIKTTTYLQLNYSDNTYDLLLIGWASKFKKNIDFFFKINKLLYTNTKIIYFDDNYGKSYLMNIIIDEIINHNIISDYLIYLDHDVWFDFNTIGSITDVVIPELFDHGINNNTIGMIFYNHLQDTRHQYTIHENQTSICGVNLCWTHNRYAYASGAFITPTKLFGTMPNIDSKKIYGFDDYQLVENILNSGRDVVVARDYYIIHPHAKLDNINYYYWKLHMIILDEELKYSSNDIWIYHEKMSSVHSQLIASFANV